MAAADYDWSRSPTAHNHSSPDMTSPAYPDRLIRPLPKRRLRSRLSDEEAKSIEFPPVPPQVSPLFNLPYVEKAQNYANRVPRGDGDEHKCQCGADHGVGADSGYIDDVDGANERATRRATYGDGHTGHGAQEYLPWDQPGAFVKPPPPGSTTSSADGYESFENTNNKKKRKIPLSGGSNHHHSSLSAEMVNMSISNPANDERLLDDGPNGVGQYYGTGSTALPGGASGTGISGAGRGRFGRPKHALERRPLGASTNGLNAFATGNSGNGAAKGKRDWAVTGEKDQGIISAAIANAAEQGHAVPAPQGSENVSLVQEAARSPPQTSQFTFSMDADAGKALYGAGSHPASNVLPGSSHVPPAGYSNKMRGGPAHPSSGAAPPPNAQQPPYPQQPTQAGANNNGAPPNQRPPRPRKPLAQQYRAAARQRRLQQEYKNYHQPPSNRNDIWICEFCEYEAIFGTEPAALVRQYEEKDRRERKRLAEKRRLLEKAKMKGRKNRKGGKKNKGGNSHANSHAPANTPRDNQQYDQGADTLPPLEPQDEEFFDDEYDDEPIAQGPPPPPTPNTEPVDHGILTGGAGAGSGGGGGTQAQGPAKAPPPSRTRKA